MCVQNFKCNLEPKDLFVSYLSLGFPSRNGKGKYFKGPYVLFFYFFFKAEDVYFLAFDIKWPLGFRGSDHTHAVVSNNNCLSWKATNIKTFPFDFVNRR